MCSMPSNTEYVTIVVTRPAQDGLTSTQDVYYAYAPYLCRHSGVNLARPGLLADDKATLYISGDYPVRDANGQQLQYMAAERYLAADDTTGYWTVLTDGAFSGADCFFCAGKLDAAELLDYAELRRTTPDVYRVTHVDYFPAGCALSDHWRIGGK